MTVISFLTVPRQNLVLAETKTLKCDQMSEYRKTLNMRKIRKNKSHGISTKQSRTTT